MTFWSGEQEALRDSARTFMSGTEVERHHRDARLLGIGGGANEVLDDLAAKLLGFTS